MESSDRARLVELAAWMRKIAAPVGPLHGYWDTIFDIEALLAGRETCLKMTPGE
jgi:hypothetical protein